MEAGDRAASLRGRRLFSVDIQARGERARGRKSSFVYVSSATSFKQSVEALLSVVA